MFFGSVILFLGLLHHSQSAPPNCQDVLKPLDHILPQDLEGNWTLVAGGLNSTKALDRFKSSDSVLMTFASLNGTSMHFSRAYSFNESCQYTNSIITLRGNGFEYSQFNTTVSFIHSACPDCLVIHFERGDGTPMPLYLFSKRRDVDKDEMEEFKMQVLCLKMSHMAEKDPTKELCPKQSN